MKDLLANMFKAKDKADEDLKRAQRMTLEEQYQKAVAEREAYRTAQEQYKYGWQDPRIQLRPPNPVPTPSIEELHQNAMQANQTVKVLYEKVMRTEKKIEQLSGFYHWVTEVHPELAAQYKAMRDLYDAANNGPREEMMGS